MRVKRANHARHGACVQILESRQLLTVVFVPGPVTAPAAHADLALGNISSFVPIEPTVAVNPNDSSNVIASSHRSIKISTNGGLTFGSSVSFANPAGTNTFNGDTDLAFDSAGRLYWVNMAGTGTAGIAVSRIDPYTGVSFSTFAVSNANDDKPQIAADSNPSSPFANNVYVVWTRFGATTEIFFSRSTNLGVSFSAPVQLSSSATQGFVWPSDVTVAANGDVYVAYHANGTFNSASGTHGRVLVRRSTDGGASFAAATEAFIAGQADVTANVQTAVGTLPGTQFWTQGSAEPWILSDRTRPGYIYVVANDDPNDLFGNGDNGDIVFARSTNDGTSWTRSTISSGPANSFQIYPTAAIDAGGDIVVAWYDNRRGLTNAAGRFKLDVMATYSTDGGLNWAPEFMVNDPSNPFDPDPGAGNRYAGPPPTTRIGEYFGIAVFGPTAHVVWNGNTFSGTTATGQQVWYDRFAINGSLTINGNDPGTGNDLITLRLMAGGTDTFEVLVNGAREYAGLRSAISSAGINGFGGDDTITLDASVLSSVNLDGGAGSNVLKLTGGSYVFSQDPALASITSITVNSGAVLTFSAALSSLSGLTINGQANLPANGERVLVATTLSIAPGGLINLNDNTLITQTDINLISAYLITGYNGGSWNGAGIYSSTAAATPNRTLGFAMASDLYGTFPSTFAGQSVNASSVLVRYTLGGDADLNRQVDIRDLYQLASNWQQSGRRFSQGDFDFNGVVNAKDLGTLATNWQQSLVPPAAMPIGLQSRRTPTRVGILD